MRICLDPGHGGADCGAVSGGYAERDLNLLISRRIKEPLIRAGHSVTWTRTSREHYPSINERPRLSTVAGCQLFVSVHCNSGPETAKGVEAWYRSGDTFSLLLAQRWLRELDELVDSPLRIRGIYPDTSNRHGRLGVLHGHPVGVRAVLLEAGFISNVTEREQLLSREYGLALGQALVRCL